MVEEVSRNAHCKVGEKGRGPLLNHLQGHLERLERRLRAGHVGQAAHSAESACWQEYHTHCPLEGQEKEGLRFLPFSHFLFLEGK